MTQDGKQGIEPQTPAAPAEAMAPRKSRVTAGVLAMTLGVFGIHKFYLGYWKAGLITLAVSVIGFPMGMPPAFMWAVGLAEGYLYLKKTDDDFQYTYVENRRDWF